MTQTWFKIQKNAIAVTQSTMNVFPVKEKSKDIMSFRNGNKTVARNCKINIHFFGTKMLKNKVLFIVSS